MAPESDIVFVNISPLNVGVQERLSNSVALLEAVDFIARTAGERPWVINVSMGNQAGQHDGLTLVERALDNCVMAGPGRVCVQSTGNYYNRSAHAAGVVRPGERETIPFTVPTRLVAPCEIDVWFSGRDRMHCELVAPDGGVARATPGHHAVIELEGRRVATLYNRLTDPNNGDNVIRIYLYTGAPEGAWRVNLDADDVVDGRYHVWVERSREGVAQQPRLDDACVAPASTTNTICNGFRTIAVGGYDPHADGSPLAPFSSSGPTRDGRQKPDLVAPGVRILAARSAPRGAPADRKYLTRMSGTSMAAPFVTGTCALMLQAAGRPLDNRAMRSLLFGSTRPAPQHDPQRVGSGYLDIAAAERAAREGVQPGFSEPRVHQEPDMIDARSFLDSSAEDVELDIDNPVWVRPTDEPVDRRAPVVAWADALIDHGVREADALLPVLLERSGLPGALVPFRGGEALSAADLFDVLTAQEGALSRYLFRFLAVVAFPGGFLTARGLRAGDLVIRRSVERNGGARLGVLAGDEVIPWPDLAALGLDTEEPRAGYYVHVADAARGFTSRGRRAWRLAGRDGRVQSDLMVVRIRTPAANEWAESSQTPTPSIFVISDGQAVLRSAPPELASLGRMIPKGSEVRIMASQTVGGRSYVEVVQYLPDDIVDPPHYWGWTAKSNVSPKKIAVTEMIAKNYDTFIHEASEKYGIKVEQIRAIMATESGGKPGATSGSAFGLMQMTKDTWRYTRDTYHELKNYDFASYWKNPQVNILFGTATLKSKMGLIGVSPDHPASPSWRSSPTTPGRHGQSGDRQCARRRLRRPAV
ncbi:MAG: S8 family serine peptidase [Nannocystis sp.]|nr:S8 family serine peptidase [Nannocystis sp.]